MRLNEKISLSCCRRILVLLSENILITVEESERSIAVSPMNSWGTSMRKGKSCRVFCRMGPDVPVLWLEKFLKNESNTSYVINQSIGGASIDTFIGEVYDFESWLPSRWPNVILIETALHSDFSWDTSFKVDNLLYLLQDKWQSKNLSRPDILFLELFSVGWIAHKFEGSEFRDKRLAHLNSFNAVDKLNEKFNRGCRGGPYINAVARFYSYPMLSAVDTLWPSFVRFFVKNPLDYSYGDFSHDNRTMWPYTYDGVHLSCKGHAFVGNEILIPFFKHQLKKKSPHSNHHLHREPVTVEDHGVRMFSPSLYVTVVTKWVSYGATNRRGMWSPIKESSEWNMTFLDNGRHSRGDGHDCYGSKGRVLSKAVFQFKVPSFCTKCKVGLAYIHSWNESFVGDVECQLTKKVAMAVGTNSRTASLGSNGTIYLKGSRYKSAPVVGSVPRETLFPVALDGGEYIIECAKQDDRFSCFTALTVYNSPV